MEIASETSLPGPTQHDLLYAYADMRAKNPNLNAALPGFVAWSWETTPAGANCLTSEVVEGLTFRFCGVFAGGREFIWTLGVYQTNGAGRTALTAAGTVTIPQNAPPVCSAL